MNASVFLQFLLLTIPCHLLAQSPSGYFLHLTHDSIFIHPQETLLVSPTDSNHGQIKTELEGIHKHIRFEGGWITQITRSRNDSTLLNESHFNKGSLHGMYTEWHPNGQVKLKGQFLKGKYSGRWYYYYSTGQLKMSGPFMPNKSDDGCLLSLEESDWDEFGDLIGFSHTVSACMDGWWIFYGKNGEQVASLYMEQGVVKRLGFMAD